MLRNAVVLGCCAVVHAHAVYGQSNRIQLRVDDAQAVAALEIMETARAGRAIPEQHWTTLRQSERYRRLGERETAMRVPFTDSSFAAYLTSGATVARAEVLRSTLSRWKAAELQSLAERVLTYLPSEARIDATVYLMIKPRRNSFVWDVTTKPAIFLWLDPDVSAEKFANTVAHELHHVGFASLGAAADSAFSGLEGPALTTTRMMRAFGEGFAMLAAAGGPEIHPHQVSLADERAVWDSTVAQADKDIGEMESFFLDVLHRRMVARDSIQARQVSFYGVQGPWYTLGWVMATTVERRFGRAELVRCIVDPRRLLRRYNEVAVAEGRRAWSAELLQLLRSGSGG